MQTIPTAEDIRARRTVRFAAGHLAAHTDWTGTLVGYNDLYDTVHVYVDAPGNSESGSKITYSRAAVEWAESTDVEHRETTLRVAGVERIIRTEIGGKLRTVKQLEAAHTKAVKAALTEMRKAGAETLRKRAAAVGEGGSDCISQQARRWERGTFPSYGTYDVSAARKPFPAPRFTGEAPAYLVEIEPGHYATADVAKQLTHP